MIRVGESFQARGLVRRFRIEHAINGREGPFLGHPLVEFCRWLTSGMVGPGDSPRLVN